MQDDAMTLHMSLKQALKKHKYASKQLVMQQGNGNLSGGPIGVMPLGESDARDINRLDGDDALAESMDVDESDKDDYSARVTQKFTDVPVIDFMNGKMRAVIDSISMEMRNSIKY